MAGPVFYDGVAEWTQTPGLTRPYILNGAIPGARGLLGTVTDGDWGYFQIEDSARFEVIEGRFVEPNILDTLKLIATSNAGAAVSWPTAGRRIVRLIPRAVTSAQVVAEATSTFWLAVAAGAITDLGDLSDAIIQTIEMGEIIAGADVMLALDLGEFLSVPVNPDNPMFWTVVSLAAFCDLGRLSDQIVLGVDMGNLAGTATAPSEVIALDLGELA